MQGDFLINLDDRSGVSSRMLRVATWFVRLALALVLASFVIECLGLWKTSAPVFWFLPGAIQPFASWVAVALQILLLFSLVAGWRLRFAALITATILLLYGAVTCASAGALAPRASFAFAAASAAFMLFATQPRNSNDV